MSFKIFFGNGYIFLLAPSPCKIMSYHNTAAADMRKPCGKVESDTVQQMTSINKDEVEAACIIPVRDDLLGCCSDQMRRMAKRLNPTFKLAPFHFVHANMR